MDNKEKKQPKNDAGYTPQEDQFADGKGTQLNEAMKSYRGYKEEELDDKRSKKAKTKKS